MGVYYRDYRSYKDYLHHQRSKLNRMGEFFRQNFDVRYALIRRRLERLVEYLPVDKDFKVLCLGARLGEEVKALRDLGYPKSIGIDLNPGLFNKYVKKGDFHNLRFPTGSIHIVYSNCLDHSLNLGRVLSESSRVLANGGYLCLELSTSQKLRERSHLSRRGNWESMVWESYDDVLAVARGNFDLVASFESVDHNFMSYVLQKSPSGQA